jgi:hypothetical protein
MSTNAIDTHPRQQTPRFRFGLKSLLLVTALLSILFGWWLSQRIRAREIVNRSHAVWKAIATNISNAPRETSFVGQADHEIIVKRPAQEQEVKQLGQLFGNGLKAWYHRRETRSHVLNVSQLLTTKSASAASAQIRSHYERGLSNAGLQRQLSLDGVKSVSIWSQPRHGQHVIIDVSVDPALTQADVRIIYLHDEAKTVW